MTDWRSKPRPARRKSDDEKLQPGIGVRLTAKEREMINDAAKKQEIPTGTWARRILVKAANRILSK